MPISIPLPLQRLDQEEFKRLDYAVMGHAFECRNDLGRLCDEAIYQRDLAMRLESAGLGPVRREFPIRLMHGDFTKVLYADLVAADSAIYELKSVNSLSSDHRRQLLTYLLLCDQPRGKLINFRTSKVESEFVNTKLTRERRGQFSVTTNRWSDLTDRCHAIKSHFQELLADWGAFLESALYMEAIAHFLGGETTVRVPIPVERAGQIIGSQPMYLATPDIVIRITSLTENQENYEVHLQRLLQHVQLRAIQWINLNYHVVEFITVLKPKW